MRLLQRLFAIACFGLIATAAVAAPNAPVEGQEYIRL